MRHLNFIYWTRKPNDCFNRVEPVLSISECTNFEWSIKCWFNRPSLLCKGNNNNSVFSIAP